MSEQFDLARLGHLLRGDVIASYRQISISAGAIAGFMILQAILFQGQSGSRTGFYIVVLALLVFLGGAIVASRAFIELNDKKRNEAYLLLPASAAEKVVARLLQVTIFHLVAAFVLVTVVSWVIYVMSAVGFGRVEPLFDPTSVMDIRLFGAYVVNQSVYFLGAAWFRKHHFIKTAFATSLLSIGLIWFLVIIARIVFPDIASITTNADFDPGALLQQLASAYSGLAWVGEFVLFGVLPVFCWVVAWMRVRETQVSHGV